MSQHHAAVDVKALLQLVPSRLTSQLGRLIAGLPEVLASPTKGCHRVHEVVLRELLLAAAHFRNRCQRNFSFIDLPQAIDSTVYLSLLLCAASTPAARAGLGADCRTLSTEVASKCVTGLVSGRHCHFISAAVMSSEGNYGRYNMPRGSCG